MAMLNLMDQTSSGKCAYSSPGRTLLQHFVGLRLKAMLREAVCRELRSMPPNPALQPTAASVACGSLVVSLLGGG